LKPFDAYGRFRPDHTLGDLRQRSVRGAGVTFLSGGLGLAVQVVAAVMLARLLTPKDFGLVTMVSTFSLLFMNFGLNGFTEAVIQREDLDHRLVSNLFWINLGTGILLTLGFAASGTLLARFYHDLRVAHITAGMSLTILFSSTSVLHLAILKRAMLFSRVSANDIVARAISVAASIVFGWAGFGYWALVLGAVALPLSQSLGAWFLCRWVPGLPKRVTGTGSMVRFAMNTYGRFSVNYFARNMDNLLVGWRFSAQSLGYYKKAYDLFALSAGQLATSLTVVVVSALSRLNSDLLQYRRYLLNALAVLAFVGMGLAGDLTLVGKDLIRLLLGPGWEPAGQIFTFFGPGIGVMVLYYSHGWIHLSIGRADRWFRWAAIEFVVTGLLFIVGLPWGPVGIAVAWTTSFWILMLPAIWYAGRPIGLGISPVLAVIWKYALASLVAGGMTAMVVRDFPTLVAESGSVGAATRLVLTSSLFLALYLGGVILLHRGCEPLYRIVNLVREMFARTRFSGSPSLLPQPEA
jgi:O-antigen/teichoic acid export membrane protein